MEKRGDMMANYLLCSPEGGTEENSEAGEN